MFKKLALASAVALTAVGLTACSNENSSSQGGTQVTKSSKKKSTPKIKYYKLGDTVKVDKVEYTLKSVETTTERNEFAEEKPKNVIKVTYHVKNDSDEDIPIGTDLSVYGPSNTKLKSYPINNSTFDSIAAGKEADVVEGYGTNKLGKFELQFQPIASIKNAAKFQVTVK